jgi:hypothetical protein
MLRSICLQDLDFREIQLTRCSTSGAAYQQWVRVGMPKIRENVIRSVFYLYATEKDALAGENPGATGFVVEITSDPMLPPHYYGVTNWHVVCDQEDIYPVIRLNTIDGGIDVLYFNPDQWEFVPGKYDVGVIPLSLNDIHAVHSINTNLFIERQNKYYVGDDVFMIGLFIDNSGISTNVPSARFGNISMVPNESATIEQPTKYSGVSYVIDVHSRTGFSGSPVFVYRTFGSDLTEPFGHRFDDLKFDHNPTAVGVQGPSATHWRSGRIKVSTHFNFLGIHWGQFPEKWELSREPSIMEARRKGLIIEGEYVKGMSGMTSVIPAWQILEVLNMPKLKRQRDAADAFARKSVGGRPIPESAGSSLKDTNPNPAHREDFTALLNAAARKREPKD